MASIRRRQSSDPNKSPTLREQPESESGAPSKLKRMFNKHSASEQDEPTDRRTRPSNPLIGTPAHQAELAKKAARGELMTIDRALEGYGVWNRCYRNRFFLYAAMFILGSGTFQYMTFAERYFRVAKDRYNTMIELQADCCCTHDRLGSIKSFYEKFNHPDTKALEQLWGKLYMGGGLLAPIVIFLTDSRGRRLQLLIGMGTTLIVTLVFYFSTILPVFYIASVFNGFADVLNYAVLIVVGLESIPPQLRPLFCCIALTCRRFTRTGILLSALLTTEMESGLITACVLAAIAFILAIMYVEETASHYLLHDRMSKVEEYFETIKRITGNNQEMTPEEIADELAFKEDDFLQTKSEYISKICGSTAVVYIINLVFIMSMMMVADPMLHKHEKHVGFYSPFEAHFLEHAQCGCCILIVMIFSRVRRMRSLCEIELLMGFTLIALNLLSGGTVDPCMSIEINHGVLVYVEATVLIIAKSFSMATYVMASVICVELAPTRARTATVAFAHTIAVLIVGLYTLQLDAKIPDRTSYDLLVYSGMYLVAAILAFLSYTCPVGMVDYLAQLVKTKNKKGKESSHRSWSNENE